MSATLRWPSRLWIVRHGESMGNVARDAAYRDGSDRIAIEGRDVDVPLSPLGERQARALGHWFMAAGEAPEVILASPYRRAGDTATLARDAAGFPADVPLRNDERLREKEFGVIDGLTTAGIARLMPDQAEFRRLLGKFYHRPPGGESWCDVILRLRSLLDTVALHHAGGRVLIVAHQVVVLCLRYIIEELDETQLLAIDRAGDVANCAVTEYRLDGDRLALVRYNEALPMERDAVPVTAEPDRPAGVRG